jgi:hypothetical protein
MTSVRLAAVALVVALLAAGCKVDTSTAITLHDDGSGTVTVRVRFDTEAVRLVESGGGKLEDRIVLSDLRDDGWKLGAWKRGADGGAIITMTHGFDDPDGLAPLLAQLTGRDGVLHDVRVTHTRNLVQQRDGVSMVADLRKLRSGVRDDEELASRLRAAGVNVDQVDFVLNTQLRKAFTMRVTLTVPREDARTFALNAGESQTVNLSSTKFEVNRFATLLIGVMLVFLALLLYLSASISARRRHARELEFAAVRARRGGGQPLM